MNRKWRVFFIVAGIRRVRGIWLNGFLLIVVDGIISLLYFMIAVIFIFPSSEHFLYIKVNDIKLIWLRSALSGKFGMTKG